MIRGVLVVSALVSTVLFPWPFTILLVLASTVGEPLTPLVVGIFADTLYYAPHAGALPVFSIYGAILTGVVFFVRSQLKTGTIG